jgi:hypothetical protein
LREIGEKILSEERMTSYEEEDEYPGGEEYGSLPKFQQFEGTGTSDPFVQLQQGLLFGLNSAVRFICLRGCWDQWCHWCGSMTFWYGSGSAPLTNGSGSCYFSSVTFKTASKNCFLIFLPLTF